MHRRIHVQRKRLDGGAVRRNGDGPNGRKLASAENVRW